jgi:uncharacterized protein (DUF488 family)
MATLFTVGHGTRSLAELIAVLHSANVTTLVDVRRFAGSRRHPHFGRKSLEKKLPQSNIEYEWWGEELGGRRSSGPSSRHRALRSASFRGYADYMDTEEFRSAIGALKAQAASRPTAVMCAETLWWRCHRRHIADVMLLEGFEVTHLLDVGKSQPHVLHPALRADEDGRPVYDAGKTQLID